MKQEIDFFFLIIIFVFTRLLVGREMVKFNSINESGCTYSPAACCGGVKQQLPLGAVCTEGLMESDSNKNLTESAKGVPPSFSSASIVAKDGG